jgi:hypothetical protein
MMRIQVDDMRRLPAKEVILNTTHKITHGEVNDRDTEEIRPMIGYHRVDAAYLLGLQFGHQL